MVTDYSCTQCLKKLSCRDSYVKHLRYHNSKQHSKFKCEKCEYAARDSCNLRRHHKQKHSIDDVPRMSVGGMDVDAVGSGRMDNVSDEGHMVDLPKVSAQEVTATRAAVQASYVTKEKHVREKLLDIFQDINVGVEGKNEKDVFEVQDNTLLVRRSVPISPNKDSKVPLSECGMEDVSVVSVGMGNVSDKVYKVGFPEVSAVEVMPLKLQIRPRRIRCMSGTSCRTTPRILRWRWRTGTRRRRWWWCIPLLSRALSGSLLTLTMKMKIRQLMNILQTKTLKILRCDFLLSPAFLRVKPRKNFVCTNS